MTNTANRSVPKQGRIGRILAAAWGFLQLMEATSFDYTLDRIERLEREVERFREDMRQDRIRGQSTLTKIAPLGSNSDSPART